MKSNDVILVGKWCILWTDLVLSLLIFTGIITVFLFGIIDVPGGFTILLEKAVEQWQNDANQYNISPHSYGSIMIGQFIIWLFVYSVYYTSGILKETLKKLTWAF